MNPCQKLHPLYLAVICAALHGGDPAQPFILLVPRESSTPTPLQFLDR